MPWKRLRRWFLRATLVCLAGLLCAAGIVWFWIGQDRQHPSYPSDEKIIATALGWPVAADDESLRTEIMRQQPLAISLLGSDDSKVRFAAKRFFRWRAKELAAPTLDAVAAELTDPRGSAREAMLVLLATSGDAGLRRIATIYRAGEPIEPELHQVICQQLNGEIGKELTALLSAIVADVTVSDVSRCRAAEALGHLERPADPELSGNQQRAVAINGLRELAPRLSAPVGAALDGALKQIDDEYSYRDAWAHATARRHARENGQEFQELSANGHEAITALADPDDWKRVGDAADALARNGVKAALPELERVATSHWYSPVRKTAQWAVNVIQGQEPYCVFDEQGRLKTPPRNLLWCLYEETKEWETTQGYLRERSVLEIARAMLRPAREAYLKRFSPHFDQVEYRRPGRLPQRWPADTLGMVPMHPKCSIAFTGGTLLGYDGGEFGRGTVFCRKGSVPLFLRTANVGEFVSMPFGVLNMPSFDHDFGPEVVRQAPDGSISVAPFKKRLPAGWGRYRKLPSGDLLFNCIGIDVVITTTGELRVAGSDKEVGAP